MFKIIGADNRAYGPVTIEQIRSWLSENRVNAYTLAQAEGSTEWKPLGSFPEFAQDLGNPVAVAHPPRLNGRASGDPRASTKIAAGICAILLGYFGVHKFILGYTGAGLIMLLVTILTCFVAAPVMAIIGVIEGIIYLVKPDEEFIRTYIENQKQWF
jgi:TM2 domain-containing membrane protein YozV